ncbi:MAG: GAP family protein, partial [Acidimicrobiia bacterium]|nr:GAP family protein [Acidimicrobiia bacterium]
MTLLLTVLPMALGAALSPTLFLATTVLLSAEQRPRARALAFLLGAVGALVLWAVLFASAMRAAITSAAHSAFDTARQTGALGDLVVGLALLAVAVVVALRPPHTRTEHHRRTAADRPLWKVALVGAVLQGRDVSSMLLFTAALQHVTVAEVNFVEQTLVVGGGGGGGPTPTAR